MDQQTTPALRWLHITDLHVGKEAESQENALNQLISAIQKFSDNRPFDLVILTGDLAYSGRAEQYEFLKKTLIEPLQKLSLTAHAQFIAVPGNHDLDCTKEPPIIWKDLGKSRQQKFFYLGPEGKATRGSRPKGFAEYCNFCVASNITTVDPINEPATALTITKQETSYKLISTVTAYFSDYETNDKNKADGPLHAIRALHSQVDPEAKLIILGHHPYDWFTQDSERQFYSFLVEHNALYVHGHDHRIKTRFSNNGLVSLGLGPGYISSLESSSPPGYKNSFAICELAESLHVCPVSWDSEHGQWRPEQSLSSDFYEKSQLVKDGYVLNLPTTRLSKKNVQGVSAIAASLRAEISIDKCIWLDTVDTARWAKLLEKLGCLKGITEIFSLPAKAIPAGHIQFRAKDQQGQNLIYAVTGHGDILHYEQLQAINTELDKQDYDKCIVVTLGTLSTDAKTLANQLTSRKSLVVIEREELVSRAIRNLPPNLERKLLQIISESSVSTQLMFSEQGINALVQERIGALWFFVLDSEGTTLAESSPLVGMLRAELPELKQIRYQGGASPTLSTSGSLQTGFDKAKYLEQIREAFEAVKYAPLAALGMKFRNTSIKDIYVDASADIGDSKSNIQLSKAVSEFVDSYNLTSAQRDQLESQLRSKYGLNRTSEVGRARLLYQKFNNVIVLGDPGSGKTCFVQHEILAYCEPNESPTDWYSHHLPIYVSLAEAARLLTQDTSLLDICEIVSSRRGIALPKQAIESALSAGKVAFFFDGLDEVSFLEKRIELLEQIGELVKVFARRGCRFVLTSRPAAVQPVEIPEELTYLNLKGLTEDEIKVLAGRVLTARIGSDDEQQLKREERELVERLLNDTKQSVGISRIARNPLLLTLLVLIYANSGTLSARRHLIYTQAIKTLVSVRGKQTRAQQISESDLRTRLGHLALGIFQRQIAEIPSRAEVFSVLAPFIPAENPDDHQKVITGFIQEVAEATGLLAIHPQDEYPLNDLITFMHYSFLEYYVAAGLLANDFRFTVPKLASNPRWREVITLLFGILSEQADITDLLTSVIADSSDYEKISGQKLLLALDSAAECDVPPELTQKSLAAAVFRSMTTGAARFSANLRNDLAEKLESHLTGASTKFESMLISGLKSTDPLIAATFMDLIARLSQDYTLPSSVVDAFASAGTPTSPAAGAAQLFAIEGRRELRDDGALKAVRKALNASVVEKEAAIKVLLAVPDWCSQVATELRRLLDDPNLTIAAMAAKCTILNLSSIRDLVENQGFLEKSLAKLKLESSADVASSFHGITLDVAQIESLISSPSSQKRELAIRYMPLVRGSSQFSYSLLLRTFKNSQNSGEKAACLDSLRLSPGAVDLITIADTDLICETLKAEHRNLRLSAIRLLGTFPDDEQVVTSLKAHLEESTSYNSRAEEIEETARALAVHAKRNKGLQHFILSRTIEIVQRIDETKFGDTERQSYVIGLLDICESMGGTTDDQVAWQIFKLGNNFRTPHEIRAKALKVFGRIVEPSGKSIDAIIQLFNRNDLRLVESVYYCTSYFISQCRKRVDYVRAIASKLSALEEKLCSAWHRETSKERDSTDSTVVEEIRSTIIEIHNLTLAHKEYSERAVMTSARDK